MNAFQKSQAGDKKYLIIPAMPTPNGRLHLGHMSGPYLKMDIITRAQRRHGNEACLISGCDAYESYVTLKAWQSGQTPEEVCQYYSDRALEDLQALDIHYDAYVNPVAPEFRQWYIDFAKTQMEDIIGKDLTEVRSETVMYSPANDRYIVGCWLLGNCPVCGSGAGSYQCEDCGSQFRPMDMQSPYSREGDTDLVEVRDKTLYLKVSKKKALWDHIERMHMDEAFKDILRVYFQQQGDYIRLTNPDHWGIPWSVPGSPTQQVIYTATYMNAFVVFMGELYKKIQQRQLNPFHPDSEVITVCSFGIDCSIPYILGLCWGIESGSFKPMDYLLPNFFCNLQDAKFSTSRGHAIWGADIVNNTPLTSDSVRYYLTKINPQHETTSFRIDDLIETVNRELAGGLQRQLAGAWSQIQRSNPAPDPQLIQQLDDLLADQMACLSPESFEMKKSLNPISEWLAMADSLSEGEVNAFWWLKGFSLLAYPIMPACATSLWNLLGHTGQPGTTGFFERTTPREASALPVYFQAVTYEDIAPILPQTLVS